MKMMKKYLSIVLSAVILIMSFPIVVNATEITDDYERVSLVEQKDERTENSKTFYTSNGTFASIVTTDAICYEDDGKFKDIDNTIVKKDTDKVVSFIAQNHFAVDIIYGLKIVLPRKK